MSDVMKTYISNMEEIFGLMKANISPAMTQEEIVCRIRENAERIYQLRCEDDRILKAVVFSRTPESLSAEECDSLFDTAQKCSRFKNSIDVGTAYAIHRLLYKAAELHNDVKRMIRELYWQGTTLYYLNTKFSQLGINLYGEQYGQYFARAAAYFADYEQLPDSETRGYVVRSMANRNLTNPKMLPDNCQYTVQAAEEIYGSYIKNWKETMSVICSPYYRGLDPDLPWDRFESSMHMDRLSFFSLIRQVEVPHIAEDLYESENFIYRQQKRTAEEDELYITPRIRVYYITARYHVHEITFAQMMDQLLEIYEAEAGKEDYSPNGCYINLSLPQAMREYMSRHPEEATPRLRKKIDDAINNSLRYLVAVPYNRYYGEIGNAVRNEMLDPINDYNITLRVRILEVLVACHAPTYVHSCMVAGITRTLIQRLLEVTPEALEGVMDLHGVEELRAHKEEICTLAWQCGLYHDIGKTVVLKYISIYGRALMDEEFSYIKLHPQIGYHLLSQIPGYEDEAETALRHHLNYDGKGGYPRDYPPCPQRIRVIVDALTVADCTDAATDNVGRCYAGSKKYETLVGELFQFSGTRYSPQIVDLFRDEKFCAELGQQINSGRSAIYAEVYSNLAKERGGV